MGKPPRNNLSGQTFGRLTVVEEKSTKVDGMTTWWCLCECKECGKHKWIRAQSLKSGASRSCGCMTSAYRLKSITKTKKCAFCDSVFLAFAVNAKFCSTKCRSVEGKSRRSHERRCCVCNGRIPYGEGLKKICGRPCCAETLIARNRHRMDVKRRQGSAQNKYAHAVISWGQHIHAEKAREADEKGQQG